LYLYFVKSYTTIPTKSSRMGTVKVCVVCLVRCRSLIHFNQTFRILFFFQLLLHEITFGKWYGSAQREHFTIAYGSAISWTLIVTLEKGGYKGYGECAAIDWHQSFLISILFFRKIKYNVENTFIIYPTEFFYTFLLSLDLQVSTVQH
jgi:hypothetical protein